MTDVNIAVELMADAYANLFDTALLVTADSDLVGAVRAVQQMFPQKRLVIAFPPGRFSKALAQLTPSHTHIARNLLAKSIFPETVTKADGYVLRQPVEWR